MHKFMCIYKSIKHDTEFLKKEVSKFHSQILLFNLVQIAQGILMRVRNNSIKDSIFYFKTIKMEWESLNNFFAVVILISF